jgi:hypothetical protein
MRTVMPWHPWPAERAWPASARDELAFVASLTTLCAGDRKLPYERADATVLITALRNGATAPEVLAWLPGVQAGAVLAAALDLELRLRAALAAWARLQAAPGVQALMREGSEVARILPAAVGELTRVMRATHGAGVPLAVAKISSRMSQIVREAAQIEALLDSERDPLMAVRLGLQLCNPPGQSLWQEPLFLPDRIGQLSRVRVDGLLAADDQIAGLDSDLLLDDD